jgi:hypothetical protein
MTALNCKAELLADNKSAQPGFAKRFDTICDELGMKKFGRTKFFNDISGLSWSGAKSCLEDDRPPKRERALHSASSAIAELLKQHCKITVAVEDVEIYLLTGDGPLNTNFKMGVSGTVLPAAIWDISHIPKSYQGQVLTLIDKTAREMNINVFTDIDERQYEILTQKLTMHSFTKYGQDLQNSADHQLKELIQSMIVVASANLL